MNLIHIHSADKGCYTLIHRHHRYSCYWDVDFPYRPMKGRIGTVGASGGWEHQEEWRIWEGGNIRGGGASGGWEDWEGWSIGWVGAFGELSIWKGKTHPNTQPSECSHPPNAPPFPVVFLLMLHPFILIFPPLPH